MLEPSVGGEIPCTSARQWGLNLRKRQSYQENPPRHVSGGTDATTLLCHSEGSPALPATHGTQEQNQALLKKIQVLLCW